MTETRYREARCEKVFAVRFKVTASSEEVVARLLEAARGTELTLLKVFGDGDRVYPLEGPDLAWSESASSWRAELFWHSSSLMSGWRLEVFLKRAEIFLETPGRVRLEIGGGQRNPREDVRAVRRARLSGAGGEAQRPSTRSHE